MDTRQRILVVDDELGPREALRMILKARYEVVTASSGAEALALVQQHPPDLVLTDIKMPGMSGIELLKAIKQSDAAIEVVMMTAYAALDTAREAVAYSASDYLIKPFTRVDVDKAVAKALARRAERAAPQNELRALLDKMRTLAGSGAHHGPAADLAQNAPTILEQSTQALYASAAVLYGRDSSRPSLVCQVFHGVPAHLQHTFEGEVWQAALAQTLAQRQPLRLPAPAGGSGVSPLLSTLQMLGWETATFFPVIVGNQALGVLGFLYNRGHEVRADWRTLGQSFADLMGLAMQAQQRYSASQREVSQQAQRVAQLSILREMTRAVMESLDLPDMLQAMGQQLHSGLGYPGVAVWLYGQDTPGLRQVYTCGTASDWLPGSDNQPIPEHLVVDSRPPCQVIRAPLVLDGRIIGAMELRRNAQDGPVAAFEHELLRMVLDYLAMAVKNAQLYGEIKATKHYLEHLINDAGDAIVTVDTSDRILAWNASAERIFHYHADDILKHHVGKLLPQEQYSQWRDQVMREGTVQHMETRLKRQNGTPVDVSVTVSPLRGAQGEIVGCSAIIRDVTEEKSLREQLSQAEKLRALGEMAAGVAHNFKNILHTILGYTQLLQEDLAENDEALESLQTIEKVTRDATQVVQRIQTFARGGTAATGQPTDLTLLVKEVIEATRPIWKEQAERQGRCIEVHFEPEPVPFLLCRAAELREVVTNLVLNAVDAMPSGGTLTIRTSQSEAHACLTVSDTGTGMPEAVRRRIFDPFFTTKKEKGTGLGLSVSHTLIKGHGGRIDVQSTPGQGTTFVVKLPLDGLLTRLEEGV